MPPGSLQSARLNLRRAFVTYFLELQSPGVADPTEVFSACREYLALLRAQLGTQEFMRRLDEETTRMAGHVEQDLRQRFRGTESEPDYGGVEDRLHECFEHGLVHLPTEFLGGPIE